MGNAQSSSEDRKHGRVLKPKTMNGGRMSVTNSPQKLELASPTIPGIPYSQKEDTFSAPESPSKAHRGKQDLRNAIRSQLLSLKSPNTSEESNGERLLLAGALARSLSRTGTHGLSDKPSMLGVHPAPSHTSLATDRNVDLETAVALLHELRKTASPDDLVALHQALLPTRSNERYSPTSHRSADSAEETMGTSAAALIRRKSLAIPGKATRTAKPEAIPESSMSTHDRVWHREMIHDSPLDVLSNMDTLEPPANLGENRSATPSDMDYSHLGSLKIGSLVVTNGLASPAPSFVSRDFTHQRRPSEDTRQEDEYYTASEGGSFELARALPALPPMESCRGSGNEATPKSEPPYTPERPQRPFLATTRSGSPLKREVRAESLSADIQSLPSMQPTAVKSAISLLALSENHSLFENTSSDEGSNIRSARERADSQSAISLASEYMAELPDNPYANISMERRGLPATPSFDSLPFDESHSNQYQPREHDSTEYWVPDEIDTSRTNLLQQHIDESRTSFEECFDGPQTKSIYEEFDDPHRSVVHEDIDDSQATISEDVDQALGAPATISAIATLQEISPLTALRSHPPHSADPRSTLNNRHSGQAKTDSGYSSADSARWTVVDQFYETEKPHLPTVHSAVDITARPGAEISLNRESFSRSPVYPQSYDQQGIENIISTPPYLQTPIQQRDPEPQNLTSMGLDSTPVKDGQTENKNMDRKKSWRKSVRRSLPRMLSSSSPKVESNASTPESKTSSKSAVKQQKKLQKKRPTSQPPFSSLSRILTDGDIPKVPSKVSSRFSTRLAASPGMECLERTYENTSSNGSKRDSACPSPVISGGASITSSYFPDTEHDEQRGRVKRLSKAIDQATPPPPPHSHTSRSLSRRSYSGHRPPLRGEDDEILGVTDFGTVAQSLGGSPYDIAMNANTRRPLSTTPTQPHQMSTNRSRFGPREGWDAETASKFAQQRSRERAVANAAADRQSSTGNGPQGHSEQRLPVTPNQRPQSAYRTPDQRPQSSYQPRPKSMGDNGVGAYGPLQSQHQPHTQPQRQSLVAPRNDPPRPNSCSTTHTTFTVFRPTPAGNLVETTTTSQAPRSPSPVKNLVSAFEQKAAISTPPRSPDWTESAKIWRDRRMQAHTTTQTSSSASANLKTTTTTTLTTFTKGPSPLPATPNQQRIPLVQRRSEPARVPQELDSHQISARNNQTPAADPTQTKFGEEGIFGRYGGGFKLGAKKREMTPRTGMVKKDFGVDLGDVPIGKW